MDETELEEGEARFDDNDANIDPDTALSYIDQRLQCVLGHFQKDFEGEVSAEILGPKFGGYGSFLPSQKKSSTVPSHSKVLNSNKPCSPNNFHLGGGALVNTVATSGPLKAAACYHRDAFAGQNALSVDNLASKDKSSLHTEIFLSGNEITASNSVNPTEQRSLKVRIKVGSDKSARKNDEIYGGLGLLSSSSNTTEDSGGPPIEPHDIPYNSPGSILRDMTSIFVPGNRLLSPLNESLICLENKVIAWIMGRKTSSLIVVDDSSVLGDGRQMEIKEVSSLDKSEVVEGMKCKNSAAFDSDMASYSGKHMETESLESKRCLTNDYKVKLSSGSITSKANQAAKKAAPVKKREAKRDLIREQLFGTNFTSKESDESYEQKNVKKLSLDSTVNGGIKGNMVHSVCKNDTDVTKHETDHFEKKVGPKATTCESLEVKVPQGIDKWPFEKINKLKSIQSSDIVTENSRFSLGGAMKDKKSALKDIVKVRNSYKDILDTMVEDPNKQTKPLQMSSGNGPIKVENVETNVIPAEVAVPQVGPAAPPDNWVGCDRCEKWRLLPIGIEPDNLPDKWLCSMSTWLPGRNHCDISEDETTRAVQEINLQLISLNQANIRLSEHTNSNVHSETVTNRFQKNKSRPEGSSSSLIETNQRLIEKNVVNKPVDMERHAAKVNGGDMKPKKLKSKTGSDQYETVTSYKIKSESGRDMVQENKQMYSSNGDHRPRDKLVISVKRRAESTQASMNSNLLDKKVEIHAKKRKLKDWQESRSYENTLESNEDSIGRKEKRLKTCNTEVKEKVKTMKIKLSSSKENLVDASHEKNQQHKEKVACKKDLESERFLLATTSNSSKISDSCRRDSLQERKASPVGSVSSSPIRVLNLNKLSPAAGTTISRKGHAKSAMCTEFPRKLLVREDNMKRRNRSVQDLCNNDASQGFGSKVELKQTEDGRKSMKQDANGAIMIPESLVKRSSSSRSKDKDERRCDPLTDEQLLPNKKRRIELDVEVVGDERRKYSNESSAKTSNDVTSVSKKISKRRTSDSIGHEKPKSLTEESKLGDMGSLQVNPSVKKDSKKDLSRSRDQNMVEPKVDATPCSAAKQGESKFIKHHGDAAANQNAKSVVTDCVSMKNLSVIGFLKEYASSQTALTAFKRAEESKDYADRLKISGFDYECNDGYFDSALKFLYAASLLEGCTTDLSKSKGTDPVNVYNTSAKLSKLCAQEYEKRNEMAVAALAYKCTEVACMRIVYCKSLVTRQDLQTSLQMVSQGDSPSSSASDVDNLNNQATMDKTMLSKSIPHPGTHVVFRNQANFTRLLDFTNDVNLAMEASMKSQYACKAASAILEEAQNKEMMISVKRVVDFSFQDVKEVVSLVQNAREAINRQGLKGNNRQN